jgi:hypothetical protein
MDDFATLAKTLAVGVGDARGSLILSRDGLVLGAHPEEAESLLKPAWLQMASLGEPERGFVEFGAETWCYVRRGPYAAFVVVGAAVRPGIAIDQMERALLAAEEARSRREGVRTQESASPPSSVPTTKPRTPLHPEPQQADHPVVVHVEPSAIATAAPAADAPTPPAPPGPSSHVGEDDADPAGSGSGSGSAATPGETPVPRLPVDPGEGSGGAWAATSEGGDDDGDEVDRFSLAREFSQLLQEDTDRADG